MEGPLRFGHAQGRVAVRVQVSENQVPGVGRGSVLARLPAGEVQVRRVIWLFEEGRLAQQEIRDLASSARTADSPVSPE